MYQASVYVSHSTNIPLVFMAINHQLIATKLPKLILVIRILNVAAYIASYLIIYV